MVYQRYFLLEPAGNKENLSEKSHVRGEKASLKNAKAAVLGCGTYTPAKLLAFGAT